MNWFRSGWSRNSAGHFQNLMSKMKLAHSDCSLRAISRPQFVGSMKLSNPTRSILCRPQYGSSIRPPQMQMRISHVA